MRRMLVSCACVLAAAAAARPSTLAEPAKLDKLQSAVEHLMTRLLTDEKDLYVGMDVEAAAKAFEGAANLDGIYHESLSDSSLAPKGNWSGVVLGIVDPDEDKTLWSLGVALLCDKYDKNKMGEFVEKVGGDLKVEIEQDESDSSQYYSLDGRRLITIALGDSVIAISVDESE